MRYLTIITLLILVMAQPVAAQSFKPDFGAGHHALSIKVYATALRHFSPLAKQGNAGGQAMLYRMYGRGEGVLKDPVMSYVWLNVAAASGHPVIKKLLNEFGDKDLAKLNASERKLALKLSKLCLDKPASCPEYSK